MRINVIFHESQAFTPCFCEASETIGVDFGNYAPRPVYPGSYIITPSEQEQTLYTAGFAMRDNLTVPAVAVAKAIVTGTLLELIGTFPVEPVVQ